MINQENRDILIGKYLAGEASPEEAIMLDDWKEQSDENRLYFESCLNLFDASYKEPDSEKAWEKITPLLERDAKIISLNRNKTVLKIAASVVLLLTLGFIARYFLMPASVQDVQYVAYNTLKMVKLQDGTDVTINPYSAIKLNSGFGKTNRTLSLKGSGYFSVTHSNELPFIVDAGNVFIKDIGTRFSIRNSIDTDTVYVHVDEGIVLLFDSLGSEVEIRASEKALYIRSKKQIIKETVSNVKASSINFSNTSLKEVTVTLSKLYHMDVKLEHPGLENCTITSQFANENLETVLGIITETLGLGYEKTAVGYTIKGKQCN